MSYSIVVLSPSNLKILIPEEFCRCLLFKYCFCGWRENIDRRIECWETLGSVCYGFVFVLLMIIISHLIQPFGKKTEQLFWSILAFLFRSKFNGNKFNRLLIWKSFIYLQAVFIWWISFSAMQSQLAFWKSTVLIVDSVWFWFNQHPNYVQK